MSNYISEELLFLILKGLPVKSLLQFRCVCKSWKQMIESRSFILANLAIQSHVLLVQNIRTEYPEYEYLVFNPDDLNLLGKLVGPDGVQTQVNHPVNDGKHHYCLTAVSTVHGVICLYDSENRLFLWNPSIRRLLRIPVPEVRSDAGDLVYDPDVFEFEFRCCGFWMDPSNNEFKIVILFIPERKYAIFKSRNQAWIEVNIESVLLGEDYWGMTNDSPMILLDGVGYWMLHDYFGDGVIVYFDFGQDKLGRIDFPELEEEEGVEYNKCVIRWLDYVAIVHCQDNYPSECKLWVMKNGSWCRTFRWDCHEYLELPLYVAGAFELVLAQRKSRELMAYDAEDGWDILDSKPFSRGWHRLAYDFVESLVFPDLDCSSTSFS